MTALPVPMPESKQSRRGRRQRDYPQNFSVLNPAYVDQLSSAQLTQIVIELGRGGVVWFKSDCAYALGADPRCSDGITALDALLDHRGHPIPVTVADDALAARIIRFTPVVRRLAEEFWPGGLGIHAQPTRFARRIGRLLHAPEGVVVRVSQSIIERQISAKARLPITSAALRDERGQLVSDTSAALELAIRLHEERTPRTRTFFIREARGGGAPRLAGHSTMVSVGARRDNVTALRRGPAVDIDDVQKAATSNHGVDWSDGT